ncbi:MAG: transglycosylase SLT domain-containing protein [Parvularculaceae bacterium]|nr:transglycosylase SLT domain-containing protein [Parvularculaceae bacterium]
MADSITAATAGSAVVTSALKKASADTGVGFDYLYRVAVRESSLNPQAKANTSSAAGLFQFIEQTWLGAVKKYGASHGLGGFATDIQSAPGGRLTVADPARRREILDLRFDPGKAAALAGELARENKAALEAGLGREVDGAELYAAHFLGAGGAKKLLSAKPGDSAAALLPAAARANRHVFFDGARERTVDEVITSFRKTIGVARDAIASFGERIEKSFAPMFAPALRDLVPALREGAMTPFGQSVGGSPIAPMFGAAGVSVGEEQRPERSGARPLERAALSAPATSAFPFEIKGLSPLALAVLQALDPRELSTRERN